MPHEPGHEDSPGPARSAPTPELPAGTVTFLFTDIEGSTELLQRLGDSVYAEVLAEHHKLLKAIVVRAGGRQVGAQGDAFFAVFGRASDAVAAAVEAQSALARHGWPGRSAPRVRMALHTGEPVVVRGDYAGLDLHRAARICAAGHGGQILLSQATSSLVAEALPPGARLRDLGLHRLKDLPEPTRIFQVLHPDLPGDFPRLASLDAVRHNLPSQLTGFIGRARQVADVKRLLSSRRLVTLTGAGGVGKTRLAVRVAEQLVDAYPDGAWLVDLATLSDEALVMQTAASSLGVREAPGHPLSAILTNFLEPKNLLIILDNCEHLTGACAVFADLVLRKCPGVKVLATSRVPLEVSGETVWSVPPLSFPDARRVLPVEDLAAYEAVQLFLERAASIQPAFELTPDNASSVAALCHRLDGIPLAIELAAARMSAMTVHQIVVRLDDRFRLLTGGSRTALPRHQTLRGAIDWSYGLLAEKERVLLRRLSVFAGGWTLEAAEGICSGGVEELDVLDTLTQLAFKSLILVAEHSGSIRYRFLETVRQYAGDRLRESDEEASVRKCHRDWYLTFAEQAEHELSGPRQAAWFDKLEAEHDNLRAAMEWSLQNEEPEVALRVAAAVREFWFVRGYMAEGRNWLEKALGQSGDVPPALRATALRTAGLLAVFGQGDYAAGREFHEASLRLWREIGDKQNIAQVLHDLGSVAAGLGEHARARQQYEESIAVRREIGDRVGSALSLHNLGRVAYRQGEYDAASTLLEESLTIWREAGDKHRVGMALTNLGLVACRRGDHARARSFLEQGLNLHRELGDRRRMAFSLEGFAALAAALGQGERAARLFGAADALRKALRSPLPPADRPDYERGVAAARGHIDEATFAAAWAEGSALTPDEAARETERLGDLDAKANHS